MSPTFGGWKQGRSVRLTCRPPLSQPRSRSLRFLTRPTGPRPSALELVTEYLDLVDVCAEAGVPLSTVKRHVRNIVEVDLTWWVAPTRPQSGAGTS